MRNKSLQRWYVVSEHWIENSENYRVKQRVTLTNSLNNYKVFEENNFYHLKKNVYYEVAYPFVKEWCLETASCFFVVESKNEAYKCTGNLDTCFAFIELMKDKVGEVEWVWTNNKFGKIDNIEEVENPEQDIEF